MAKANWAVLIHSPDLRIDSSYRKRCNMPTLLRGDAPSKYHCAVDHPRTDRSMDRSIQGCTARETDFAIELQVFPPLLHLPSPRHSKTSRPPTENGEAAGSLHEKKEKSSTPAEMYTS